MLIVNVFAYYIVLEFVVSSKLRCAFSVFAGYPIHLGPFGP